HRRPVGKNLGDAVGAARPKRCPLCLRHFLRLAKHLATRCLVKTGADASLANRFQNANGSDAGHIGGVFRNIEAYADMALRTVMVMEGRAPRARGPSRSGDFGVAELRPPVEILAAISYAR